MPKIVKADGTPVAKLEFTSIHALLTYAAYRKQMSEAHVREAVARHFGIPDVKNIPDCDYDAVVQFLTAMPDRVIAS